MKSLSVKLGVILIGILIFGYAKVWGANWMSLREDNFTEVFGDAESVVRPSGGIIRMWLKTNYREQGVIEVMKQLGEKAKNLSYSLALLEINCNENKCRYLTRTFYSKEKLVLNSTNTPSEWRFIIPDTLFGALHEMFCK